MSACFDKHLDFDFLPVLIEYKIALIVFYINFAIALEGGGTLTEVECFGDTVFKAGLTDVKRRGNQRVDIDL